MNYRKEICGIRRACMAMLFAKELLALSSKADSKPATYPTNESEHDE